MWKYENAARITWAFYLLLMIKCFFFYSFNSFFKKSFYFLNLSSYSNLLSMNFHIFFWSTKRHYKMFHYLIWLAQSHISLSPRILIMFRCSISPSIFIFVHRCFHHKRGTLTGKSESYTSILRPRSRRGEYVEYVPLPPVRKRSLFFNSRLSSGVSCFSGSVLSLKEEISSSFWRRNFFLFDN